MYAAGCSILLEPPWKRWERCSELGRAQGGWEARAAGLDRPPRPRRNTKSLRARWEPTKTMPRWNRKNIEWYG